MNVKKDKRYSVCREFCGHEIPPFVARFCGAWVACAATEAKAWEMAEHFNDNRMKIENGGHHA